LLNSQEYRSKQWPIGALAFLIFRSPLSISEQGRSSEQDKFKAGLEGGNFQWLVLFLSSISRVALQKQRPQLLLPKHSPQGFGKRVLVIDLDPQTNATVMLLGETRWKQLNEKGWTLASLFKDALEPQNKTFNLEETLQRKVSDVQGAEKVDLLPSSLDLIDVQDKLASAPTGQFYSVTPIDLLRLAVKAKLDDYDLVLVDCPPNLGIITLNGLRISEGYIIPTVPDVLSTYGIPQIIKRVRNFSREIAEEITPIGIVITKFQANSTTHVNVSRNLRTEDDPPLFNTVIRQADQFAFAAEFQSGGRRTLKQKYGYGDLADRLVDLAQELLKKLEMDE
jgi:chromosome partitioning protein